MGYAIDCRAIRVAFGPKTVLDGLNLRVKARRNVRFLGPNGAGKSTTIKTILGLVKPTSGEVLVHGVPQTIRPHARRIGFCRKKRCITGF